MYNIFFALLAFDLSLGSALTWQPYRRQYLEVLRYKRKGSLLLLGSFKPLHFEGDSNV